MTTKLNQTLVLGKYEPSTDLETTGSEQKQYNVPDRGMLTGGTTLRRVRRQAPGQPLRIRPSLCWLRRENKVLQWRERDSCRVEREISRNGE